MSARWFQEIREEKEKEVLQRLLHLVRDRKSNEINLTAGLTTILELRNMQQKLEKAADEQRKP